MLEELLIEKLDGVNKDIAVLKIKGFSYEDIASVLQISKQFIYRRMVKIKNTGIIYYLTDWLISKGDI